MASEVVKRVAGTYVGEGMLPAGPTLAWLRRECRSGRFRPAIDSFCAGLAENVDADRVVVESVEVAGLRCSVPFACRDHESSKPFVHEIEFLLNPQTGHTRRLA